MELDLECRICRLRPRPNNLEMYGLCLEGGHMTCHSCAMTLINGPTKDQCPVCKRVPFKIKSDNVLANTRLKELADKAVYECETCEEGIPGTDIEEHEYDCAMERRKCSVCRKCVPLEEYFGLTHECFGKRCAYRGGRKKRWEFCVTLDDLLNNKGLPTLLVHSRLGGIKGLFTHVTDLEGLKVDLTWLDVSDLDPLNSKRVRVGAFAHYKEGPLGRYKKGPMKTEPLAQYDYLEPLMGDYSLFVAKKWVDRWPKYSYLNACTKCKIREAHIHFTLEPESPI